ncbi:MAG: signal transduction histidine kinase [Nitriliruptoraceae bacterium]
MRGGVALVVLALLLFALPLALVLRQQLVASGLDGFAGSLEQTATLIDERSRTCAELQATLTALAREDVQVAVFDRDGAVRFVQSRDLEAGEVPLAGDVVARAVAGATGSALLDGQQVVAVPLSTLVCGDRLVLQGITDGAPLEARVRRAWLLLAAAAAVSVAAGGTAASFAARRLTEPLEQLARSAAQLGDGDFTTRAPRSAMPETDAIADALDQTADRLGRAVARGTAFAADASHQLRTPLTALRLQIEQAQAGGPDAADALVGALDEADRLDVTIVELVALTEVDDAAGPVDLGALVIERLPAWERRAADEGRLIQTSLAPVGMRTVRPAAIGQALEVLVDNALAHGAGTITVSLLPSAPDASDDAVRLQVADEGPGFPEGLAALADRQDRGGLPVRGGRGLPLARDLVESEGGRLVLGAGPGGTALPGGAVGIILLPGGRRGVPPSWPAP